MANTDPLTQCIGYASWTEAASPVELEHAPAGKLSTMAGTRRLCTCGAQFFGSGDTALEMRSKHIQRENLLNRLTSL